MAVYELINPSDQITFEGDSDQVAIAAGLLLGEGKVGMRKVGDAENIDVLPLLLFANEEQINAALGAHDMSLGTLSGWMDANKAALADFLESVLYGSARDRELFTAMTAKLSVDEVRKQRAVWNERKRSSLNDYGAFCLSFAKGLRK